MDEAAKGERALEDGNFKDAVEYFTKALKESPTSPNYFIKRSTAYQRSKRYQEALDDAERGVIYANQRGKRELILQAQIRRMMALYCQDRFQEADAVMKFISKLDPQSKEQSMTVWRAKIQKKIDELPSEQVNKPTEVLEMPEMPKTATETPMSKPFEGPKSSTKAQPNTAAATPQIRHEWYQNTENVYLTLLAKNIAKDTVQVDLLPRSLSISFPLPTGSTYDFSLDPFFDTIHTETSTWAVKSTKIEVVLKKATPGRKWGALESTADAAAPTITPSDAKTAPAMSPAYPTSSISGPKNWDKIAVDSLRKEKGNDSDKPKDSAADNIDDDDEGGDPVNGFFKKLYACADPDTRRAMIKSFQESNGTSLSTNWGEVSKAPVETVPPDGMVAKKWGK